MVSQPDGPFINLSKINFSKYAQRPTLSKVCFNLFLKNLGLDHQDYMKVSNFFTFLFQALFEYIFLHENDVRNVSIVISPLLLQITDI